MICKPCECNGLMKVLAVVQIDKSRESAVNYIPNTNRSYLSSQGWVKPLRAIRNHTAKIANVLVTKLNKSC